MKTLVRFTRWLVGLFISLHIDTLARVAKQAQALAITARTNAGTALAVSIAAEQDAARLSSVASACVIACHEETVNFGRSIIV
jgi:hypothetical protein